MTTQKTVTILLIATIGFIITAFVGCTSDDQSTSSTSIKDIEIPTTVWDILQESDELSSDLKLGRMDKLLELVEQSPPSWEGKIMRAQALDTSFQKKKALEAYIEVAKKYGNRTEPWIGIGKLCYDAAVNDMTMRRTFIQKETGRYVFNPDDKSVEILLLARKYLRRARTLSITPLEHSSQAEIQLYLFSPDKAEKLLREVESMIARYWYLQGKDARQQGNHVKALEAFEKGLAIKPDDWNLHIIKCDTLADLGQYNESLEAHEQLVRLAPLNTFVLSNYGVARLAAKGFPWPIKGKQGAMDSLNKDLLDSRHKIRMSAYTVLKVLAAQEDRYAKIILQAAESRNPGLRREFVALEFDTTKVVAPKK